MMIVDCTSDAAAISKQLEMLLPTHGEWFLLDSVFEIESRSKAKNVKVRVSGSS